MRRKDDEKSNCSSGTRHNEHLDDGKGEKEIGMTESEMLVWDLR
jgi:hypothetical protein